MTTSDTLVSVAGRRPSVAASCSIADAGATGNDRKAQRSLLRSFRRRSCPDRSLLAWPQKLLPQLLLAALLGPRQAGASLTTQPQLAGRFYDGIHASPLCEATFRCDTSSHERIEPVCSCHPNCSLYDACCEDVRPSDWNRHALAQDAYECAVYPSLGTTGNGIYVVSTAAFVFLITGCPSNYTGSCLADLCGFVSTSNTTDGKWRFTWVTDQLTGVIYKNRFCAACHGITEEQMVFWNQSYTCMNDPGLSRFGLSGCMHNVLPTEFVVRQSPRCHGPYYSRCPNGSSQQLREACTNSPARFFYDRSNFVTYRNYNCSLCDLSRSTTSSDCTPNGIWYSQPPVVDVKLVSGARGCLHERMACDDEQLKRLVNEPCTAIDFLMNGHTGAATATPGPTKALHDSAFRLTIFTAPRGTQLLYSVLPVYAGFCAMLG